MTWIIAFVVIVAVGVAATAAVGHLGQMEQPVRDVYAQDLPETPVTSQQLKELRFGVALRGYSMSQVDQVLDRLTKEIAERDELIGRLVKGEVPEPADASVWGPRNNAAEQPSLAQSEKS